MTIQQAYQLLVQQLYTLYSDREAQQVADWVLEHITGFTKIDRVLNKQFLLNNDQEHLLEKYTVQLLDHAPVQYVLEEAWFAGIPFYVNEHVLIPRPETAELVEWIVNDYANASNNTLQIIDIGTGSGCIPIALKKKLPIAGMTALDVSAEALQVAQHNAVKHQTDIDFKQANILNKDECESFGYVDIIVSNPPYIPQIEAAEMQQNVLAHEPHIALFVPNEEALLFYKAIAHFARNHLKNNGQLYLEINERFGNDVCMLLEKNGFTNINLRQDLQGKDRMIKATYLP